MCLDIVTTELDSTKKSHKTLPLPAIPPDLPYHFTRKPFISPLIIKDLSVWISDNSDQIVEISLDGSQESNRYFGEVISDSGGVDFPFVEVRDEEDTNNQWPVFFRYKFIGKTKNNIYVLLTKSCGGGSLVSTRLMLVKIVRDIPIEFDDIKNDLYYGKERVLLRKIVEIPLGGGWYGKLSVKGNMIMVGENENEEPGYQSGFEIDCENIYPKIETNKSE